MVKYDAVVVGSGPNGYAAGIRLLQKGFSVLMLEANEEVGGGLRSSELTLPGFVHDIGSTVHPLAMASPYLSTLPLKKYGLEWVHPTAPLAHPMPHGQAVLMHKDIEATAVQLGEDYQAYLDLMKSAVNDWDEIAPDFLGPLRWPKHPVKLAKFGVKAIQPATLFSKLTFKEEQSKALFAGLAAHSTLPLDSWASSAVAIVLGGLAHKVGWPFPKGGAQSLTNALDAYFRALGGKVEKGYRVKSLSSLPSNRMVIIDTAPNLLLDMEDVKLPWWYRKQLESYKYGQGVFKVDWALSEPIPWINEKCKKAATIHIGPTEEEIAKSEAGIWKNKHSEKPYVLLVQSSLFDKSRAPEGKHTVWAYCHVPANSAVDMTSVIENQIERFAPGFRDVVLKRHTFNTQTMEAFNANYVGGDINCGAQTIDQLFTRPVYSLTPYRTAIKGVYFCSSATPPGGGVHGMCGYHAANTAIQDCCSG